MTEPEGMQSLAPRRPVGPASVPIAPPLTAQFPVVLALLRAPSYVGGGCIFYQAGGGEQGCTGPYQRVAGGGDQVSVPQWGLWAAWPQGGLRA